MPRFLAPPAFGNKECLGFWRPRPSEMRNGSVSGSSGLRKCLSRFLGFWLLWPSEIRNGSVFWRPRPSEMRNVSVSGSPAFGNEECLGFWLRRPSEMRNRHKPITKPLLEPSQTHCKAIAKICPTIAGTVTNPLQSRCKIGQTIAKTLQT